VAENWEVRRASGLAVGGRNVRNEKLKNIIIIIIIIQRMWNVKTRVIPVIIGATGTISKSFRKYVSDIS